MNKAGVIGNLHTNGFHADSAFEVIAKFILLNILSPLLPPGFDGKPDLGQLKKKKGGGEGIFLLFSLHLTRANFNLAWVQWFPFTDEETQI